MTSPMAERRRSRGGTRGGWRRLAEQQEAAEDEAKAGEAEGAQRAAEEKEKEQDQFNGAGTAG